MIRKLLLLLVILFSIPCISAKSKDVHFQERNTPTKPHDTGQHSVRSYYEDGYLYIIFHQQEGRCLVGITVHETGEMSQYSYSTHAPIIIPLGNIGESYSITLETTTGRSYYGELNL